MSKSAEDIDKILFYFTENNLTDTERTALLSLMEKNGIKDEDLKLWQSIRLEEDLPDTSDIENEILARTSGNNRKWIYNSLAALFLIGTLSWFLWPADEAPVPLSKSLPKPKQSVSIHADYTNDSREKPQKLIKQKPQIEPEELPEISIKQDSLMPVAKEPVQTIVTEIAPDVQESFSQTAIPKQIDTNATSKPMVLKKKTKKSFKLSPSKEVIPVNRDF